MPENISYTTPFTLPTPHLQPILDGILHFSQTNSGQHAKIGNSVSVVLKDA